MINYHIINFRVITEDWECQVRHFEWRFGNLNRVSPGLKCQLLQLQAHTFQVAGQAMEIMDVWKHWGQNVTYILYMIQQFWLLGI